MSTPPLLFIGAGNMARSLIGGLIDEGYPTDAITVTDINPTALDAAQKDFGIHTTANTSAAVQAAVVIVLAVKPQCLRDVCDTLRDPIQLTTPLVVSVAAGIRSFDLDLWLGGGVAIVRCMPNTPALIRCGVSGAYANRATDPIQRRTAQRLLSAVGRVVWVEDEDQIDAVTAVSGSGPAYFFLIIEAMQAEARSLGLSAEQADTLVLETAFGASSMARASTLDIVSLRAGVTSKDGTTAAAIEVFEDAGLRDLLSQGIRAAAARSSALGRQLGGS